VPAKSDFFAGFDGSSMNLIKAAGAFILVLALLLIFLKLLSRVVKGRSFRGDQTFTLRGTLALDSRRYLAAVEVDGQLLVVGVTQDRLTALGQWPLLEEDEPFRDLPPQPFTEPEEVRPAKRPPKTPPGKKPKPAPAPPEIFEKQLQPAQPVLPVQAAQAARAVQPTEPIQTIETPPPAEPVQPVQPVRFRQPPAPAVPAAVPDLVRLDESLKTESVRLPEPIELEPLTILDQRLSSPVSGREDDSLSDFTLTLEDEPFTGPEANDEFLDLDLDVPPDRRR
jgi:flagellar biogenesis protein FliO